jgi:hypothetical protein
MNLRLGWAALVCLSVVTACSKTASTPTTPTTPEPTAPAPAAAAALSAITLGQASIAGNGAVSATVSLTAAAATDGASVTLSSNNAAASVPASVTVPAGATNQTFTVTTFTPSVNRTVTITASYAGVVKSAELIVQAVAAPPPSSPSLTGGWAGRLTFGSAFVDFRLDIIHGVSVTGTCALSDGRTGTFSFNASASRWNADPINLQGGCITGGLDVDYDPRSDTLKGWWKADYAGSLSRR